MSGAPEAVELRADRRSPYIRLPSVVCGVVLGSALAAALVTVAVGAPEVAERCVPAIAVPFIVLVIVRRVASATRLTVSAAGVAYRGASGAWSMAWPEVAGIATRGPLAATHRGGIAAGVRLARTDGTTTDIPDLFSIKREALAGLLAQYRSRAVNP